MFTALFTFQLSSFTTYTLIYPSETKKTQTIKERREVFVDFWYAYLMLYDATGMCCKHLISAL